MISKLVGGEAAYLETNYFSLEQCFALRNSFSFVQCIISKGILFPKTSRSTLSSWNCVGSICAASFFVIAQCN